MRRVVLGKALIALPLLFAAAVCAAQPARLPLGAPSPVASAAPQPRTIAWETLAPPGWDGMKEFRRLDLAAMQDGDPKATELLQRMRKSWDSAPVNMDLIGKAVRIAGYVVPLEENARGLKEFLLVPYHGACIHTPPPPANQVLHVTVRQPIKGVRSMDTVWVSGVLAYARVDSYMGVSNWSLPAQDVQPYADGLKPVPLR